MVHGVVYAPVAMTSLITAVFKRHCDMPPSVGESDYRPSLLAGRRHKVTAGDRRLRRTLHLKCLAWPCYSTF